MAGLLSDHFEDLQYRGAILPFGRTKKGSTVFATPGLLVDAIKSMELPGRALRGENISADDVTKMAMDTMGGGGLLSRAVPTGDVGGLLGINVFHGGPNRWAPEPGFPQGRPRLDKMGTGEGAQAYGHGFYSAEAPGVATGYRDALQRMGNPSVKDRTGSFSELLSKYYPASEGKYSQQVEVNGLVFQGPDQVVDGIKGGLIKKGDVPDEIFSAAQTFLEPGTLYKLDIPDADAAKFLDYDARIKDQPKELRDALFGALEDLQGFKQLIPAEKSTLTGQQLYQKIVDAAESAISSHPDAWLPSAKRALQQEAASEALRKAGIPGLKYFDQGSRSGSNKSVFVDGADVRDSRFVSEQSAADIYLKHDGNIEKALNEAKQKFADLNANAKDTPQWFSARDTMRVLESWGDDPGVLTIKDVGTRNYVTWDQDVLDRTKILERQ
tara:strand:+ start:344 stop:1663 length:1320 start_codon:yes stop_codon:yes gene_type:complete